MPIEKHFSQSWKNILKCREVGINLLNRNIRDGCHTSLWFDPWIKGKSLINLLGWNNLLYFGIANAKVSSIIQNNQWNTSLQPAAHILKNVIEDIAIDLSLDNDNWSWKLSNKDGFSFKNTWQFIKGDETDVDWYNIVWNTTNCLKMSHCTYFAILNRLPTRDKCKKWDRNGEIKCLLCKEERESINHLLFDCMFARHI